MPSFNFAKGKSKKDETASAAEARQQTTGQQWPVAPHSQGPQSNALNSAPERAGRVSASPPATATAASASASMPVAGHSAGTPSHPDATRDTASQSPAGSVLDKYPQRDLSHLTGMAPSGIGTNAAADLSQPQANATASSESMAGPSDGPSEMTAAVPGLTGDAATPENVPPTAAEKTMSNSSGKGPLVAILVIVALLVLIAFIWHVNPWPPLKDGISGLFTKKETPVSVKEQSAPEQPATAMRSWDYFIQVSSWRELTKADLDAERFRAQGFAVIVESEFLQGKGGTWYRVRLGPFESSEAARETLAAGSSMIPKGAYVDSVRLAEDLPLTAGAPETAVQSTSPDGAGTPDQRAMNRRGSTQDGSGSRTTSGESTRLPGRNFDVVDEPMSGWAVKVSSLKNVDIARDEARKLLQQGYPSFITRKNIGGTMWYRVLVGPFSDRGDADRYQQLLNVTYGNDAYTVNLSAD